MKLATVQTGDKTFIGIVNALETHILDCNDIGISYQNMNDLIAHIQPSEKEKLSNLSQSDFEGKSYPLTQVTFLSPIPHPIHDIICLGINYSDHADEIGMNVTEAAVYFSKRAAVTGGHMGEIDGNFEIDSAVDYEVELAVIIGKKCRSVSQAEVGDYIFGYTIMNDVSSRTLQLRHKQWYLGKSTDGFAVMGPWIVTSDELPLPFSLNLCSKVNGEVRQKSNTKMLLHGIPEIISELSQSITLMPGDIIATGTPSGVGMGFSPPLYLKKGDTVECEVEGIGVLCNSII